MEFSQIILLVINVKLDVLTAIIMMIVMNVIIEIVILLLMEKGQEVHAQNVFKIVSFVLMGLLALNVILDMNLVKIVMLVKNYHKIIKKLLLFWLELEL